MTEPTTCPLPTPELVAALANQYIEERLHGVFVDEWGPLTRAFNKIVAPFDMNNERHQSLVEAAASLAEALSYPAPYETQVTLQDGRRLPPERHTITYFTDGEAGSPGLGFEHKDWACISALAVGESYIVQGEGASMRVERKE